MTHFSDDFLPFLRELAANNNRDWFNENRKRYEGQVREPWKAFVAQVIAVMGEIDSDMAEVPVSKVTFRINRDVRFSKDKTPYNSHVSAGISPTGRKDMTPGLYVHAGADKFMIGGGAYWTEKDDLYFLREKLANESEVWRTLTGHADFSERFGAVQGKENKRLPVEFRVASETCPDLFRKQFFYMAELPAETVERPDLLELVAEYANAAEPVRGFLRDGLKSS